MNLPALLNLTGRTALVTGSSRGIGRSIALALAEAGADIALHGTSDGERVQQVRDEILAKGVRCAVILKNLAEHDAAKYLLEQVGASLGKLDILVTNASVQLPKPWLEGTREDFELQVQVNFRCSYELIQMSVPAMQERGWGRILTVGSVQESKPHPDMLVYAATKCAQTSMAQNLAKQLGPSGITINNLAPGVIGTDRNLDRLADKDYLDRVLSWIPVAKIGKPEDCAATALLLCSDAGAYITGQNIFVDGGMSL
ncbi:SDR family NAD(P)-dependent oxidoreductase [Puniceicoccus vermicola]|uniref:SDR family oxidoreductase n=1 Tax=Puniceicoccus vermicola TaxID=388746 RepID=A0A7X1AZ61_9BACT|nr:SDR family oxidoreductase [Puniceicoccus vermicola]MBC2602652.1 SDR family oxidoreductase [Puniceicoccus vermicola]